MSGLQSVGPAPQNAEPVAPKARGLLRDPARVSNSGFFDPEPHACATDVGVQVERAWTGREGTVRIGEFGVADDGGANSGSCGACDAVGSGSTRYALQALNALRPPAGPVGPGGPPKGPDGSGGAGGAFAALLLAVTHDFTFFLACPAKGGKPVFSEFERLRV